MAFRYIDFSNYYLLVKTSGLVVNEVTFTTSKLADDSDEFCDEVCALIIKMMDDYSLVFDFELDLHNQFSKDVLDVLKILPKDKTINIKEIVKKIGLEKGSSAVSKVLASCPYQFVFPIHNVKSSNRYLTIFNGDNALYDFMRKNYGGLDEEKNI